MQINYVYEEKRTKWNTTDLSQKIIVTCFRKIKEMNEHALTDWFLRLLML